MPSQKFAKHGTIRSMRIVSLNVGLPAAQRYEGREVITGGAKKPVPRAMLRFGNFDGDRQADRVNHGGLEKAVCVYPFDHYPYWSNRLGRDLEPGAFSENLTVFGAIETEVCVGDVFRIGEATVQVSQPRMPCIKLAGKNGSKMLPKLIANVGYTGFYMRVLSEGLVDAGHGFDLFRAHPDRITIADVNTSRRCLPLNKSAVAALKAHRLRQNEERLRLGGLWADRDLVFPNRVGKPINPSNFYHREFRVLLQKSELEGWGFTFHSLRHTFATELFRRRMHPKVVQSLLGHSSITQTMDRYSHLLEGIGGDAVEGLDESFG